MNACLRLAIQKFYYICQCNVLISTATATCVLCSYLFGQLASLIRRVEDLIVEDREVEGKAKTDGVRGRHVFLADLKSLFVGIK